MEMVTHGEVGMMMLVVTKEKQISRREIKSDLVGAWRERLAHHKAFGDFFCQFILYVAFSQRTEPGDAHLRQVRTSCQLVLPGLTIFLPPRKPLLDP